MQRTALAVFSLLLGAVCIFGQQPGQQPGGAPSGTPRTPTTPQPGQPGQPGQGQPGQRDPFGGQQSNFPDMQAQRTIFLSGKVMLDDGTAPSEPVTILRVCNGQRHPETYTNSKGHFSFQLGGDPTLAMTDASVSGPSGLGGGFGGDPTGDRSGFGGGMRGAGALGQVDLTGCDLTAELPGFRSDVLPLARRSVFDNPDVGVIILHRLANVEGTAVSFTTLAAPKKAKKAFEDGVKEMRKPNPNTEKAAKELEKAVAEYPQYAAAWTALGDVRTATNNLQGAFEAYTKAREADPKYLRPYLSLARLSMQSNRWEETAELCDAALRLNPHLTELRYYHAVASFYEGEFEDAEKSAAAIQSGEQAQKFPQTHQILGMIHAKQGNFSKAATEYRSFLTMQPAGAAADDLKRQLTEWEALGVIPKPQTP